jgi:hypothetical protein
VVMAAAGLMGLALWIWHVSGDGGHPWRATLVALIVMAGAVTGTVVRSRRERLAHHDGVDGEDHAREADVQALVLRDTLVVLPAVLVGLVWPETGAAAIVVLLVVLADFWLRSACAPGSSRRS